MTFRFIIWFSFCLLLVNFVQPEAREFIFSHDLLSDWMVDLQNTVEKGFVESDQLDSVQREFEKRDAEQEGTQNPTTAVVATTKAPTGPSCLAVTELNSVCSSYFQVAYPPSRRAIYSGPAVESQVKIKMMVGSVVSESCRNVYSLIVCSLSYPECKVDTGKLQIVPMCSSLCQMFYSACGAQLPALFNCTVYPSQGCSVGNFSVLNSALGLVPNCISEMSYNPTSRKCEVKCPEPLYPEEIWSAAKGISDAFSWISFLLLVTLMIILIVLKEATHYPQNLIFFMTFCLSLCYLGLLLNSVAGHDNVWCTDATTPATQSHAICGTQGIFLQAGMMGAAWFSSAVAISFFSGIVLSRKPEFLFNWIVSPFIWIMVIAFAVASLSEKCIGYSSVSPRCFITTDCGRYFLIIGCLVHMVITLILSLTFLVPANLKINQVKQTKKLSRYSNFMLYVSPTLHCVTVCVVQVFVIAFVSTVLEHEHEWRENFEKYIVCKISGYTNCTFDGPNSAFLIIYYLVETWAGLIIFFIYGFPRLVRLWQKRTIHTANTSVSTKPTHELPSPKTRSLRETA